MDETSQKQSGEGLPPPLLDTAWKHFIFGLFVIAAPIFDFIFIDVIEPDWQTGNFSDYIHLFLSPEASVLFFPLLVYSIISYLLLLSDNNRYGKSFLVRFGIYTGVWLALQYSILTLFSSSESPLTFLLVLFAFSVPVIFTRIYLWMVLRWGLPLAGKVSLVFGGIVFLAGSIVWENPLAPLFFLVVLSGIAAPFWSFLIALQAARWLWKYYEANSSLVRGVGFVAWLSACGFALRYNILKMFELYNALPVNPPDCYIATAAANGHSQLVGSQVVTLVNGKTMRVNRQLQRLKAVEIAWMGASASSHGMMRRVYDVVGKRLAKHIQNPILADAAFFFLLPIEWISFFVLQWIVPEIQILSERLYRS